MGNFVRTKVCITNNKLKPLKPALRGWIKANLEYSRHLDDALYWYNERANIGALAAGAWLSGMLAVEEYAADKKPLPKKSIRGRPDLYISNKSTDNEFTIEAKIQWSSFGTKQSTIEAKLKTAHDAASWNYDTGLRVGALFIVPRQEKYNEKELKGFCETIQQVDCDALAWCFPATNTKLHEDKRSGKSKRLFPGVALLMKIAPKGK